MKHQGKLVVISAPSGGGKNTVIKKLMSIVPHAGRIVTTTSREPRPNEVDGVDYHFLSKENFEKQIQEGAFIEYAIYADHYYGVEKKALETGLSKFDIAFILPDVQGKKKYDELHIPHVSIFLIPESMELLRKNIGYRGGMDEATLEKRMKVAEQEIKDADLYDYRVINKDGKLDEAVSEIAQILDIDKKASL